MIVILRTRCGCERPCSISPDHGRQPILVAMYSNMQSVVMTADASLVPQTTYYETRTFTFEGRMEGKYRVYEERR